MPPSPAATFVVLPLERDQDSILDACLGAALSRSLERKLATTGARVLPARAGTRACEALGLETPLDGEDAAAVLSHARATHVVQGTFEREAGKLALSVTCFSDLPEPVRVRASGEAASFQDLLERTAREIASSPGSSFRRETESWDAFLALARAQAALLQGDVAQAEDEIAAALRLDPRWVEPHEVAASAARDIGDGERAQESLLSAIRLHREAGRAEDEAHALLALGDALVDAGKWDEGTRAYEDAGAIFEKAGSVRGVVQARSSVANVHLRRGDHARAIAEYKLGLERVAAPSPGAHAEDAAKLAFNLGTAHKLAGDLDEAAKRFEEARRLGVLAHDDDLIANAWNALGTVRDEQGDLDASLSSYRRAEEHLEARADPVLLAGVKDNIGIVLKKRADLEAALEYSAQACALFETHGDPHRMAIAWTNRAGLLLDLDRGDEALKFALSAHRIFVQLGSPQSRTTESLLVDLGVDPAEAGALDGETGSSPSSSDDEDRS